MGLIPGSGSFPGEGNDNPLHYSCLENPMDRGAWQASVYGVTKSQTQIRDWTTSPHVLRGSDFLLKFRGVNSTRLLSLNPHGQLASSKRKGKESEVAQSPNSLWPLDYSLPGSSVQGIFQARVLEWVAISFSRGSSQPRDQTQVPRIAGRRFTLWATGEAWPLVKAPTIPWEPKGVAALGTWTCHRWPIPPNNS